MNIKKLVIKMAATFVEAAVAFLSMSHWDFTNRVVLAGAVGSALSAVWNTTLYPMLQQWLNK